MTKHVPAWLCAVLVPLAYVLFYTPYGMDTTDFGYFYGYGWRILQGQVPYRDFHYIKPALPLYWHALWMWLAPENGNILCGKIGFVAEMLAASWCAALYLHKIFRLPVALPLLATCGFVFGVHSFPHMPWHTADGVLFGGAALLASVGAWPLATVCAGILATCAMLCKQSFLLVPPALVLLVWTLRGRRQALCCLAGWLGTLALVYALLLHTGALAGFTRMTTGQLALSEAIEAAILIYVRQNWLLPLLALLPCGIFIFVRRFSADKDNASPLPGLLQPAATYLVILTAWYVVEVFRTQGWIGYGASWPTLWLLLGCGCALASFLGNGGVLVPLLREEWRASGALAQWRAFMALAAALLVAWSVAISGGYKIPAFFAVPLVFSFLLVHKALGGQARRLAWAVLVAGLVMFGAGYQHPYVFPVRPMPRAALTMHAGDIYPKADGVYVDADMYARLAELKELRAKYGPNYKTLPGFCLSYYLNDDTPCYGSDWLIDWEINAETDDLYRELLDRRLTVFMERDQLDAAKADNYDRAGYTVPQRVRHEWRQVDATPHFVVFQPPQDGVRP